MLPGQEVNKDVYAVNTGNIGAFVKETVSGKLTYTYEKRVPIAPDAENDATEKAKYVELNENIVKAINGQVVDGATSQEAGGYLAYTTTDEPLGVVNSARINDASAADTQVEPTRWHPTKTGVYIFKRAEKTVDDEINPGQTKTEYKYAGYYYVAPASTAVDDPATTTINEKEEGKYYKIVIGTDPFRASNDAAVKADTTGKTDFVFDITVDQDKLGGATVDATTGNITTAVPVQFVKNITVENVTPNLTYHKNGADTTKNAAYLEASYTDSEDAKNKSDALAAAQKEAEKAAEALVDARREAAQTEVTYENLLGEYNTAKSRYEQAYADWKYADDLANASTKLINAAKDRGEAEVAKDNARDLVDDALAALKKQVNSELEGTGEAGTTTPTGGNSAHTNTTDFSNLLDFADSTKGPAKDISYASIFQNGTTTLENTINSAASGNTSNQPLMQQAKIYMGRMAALWSTQSDIDGDGYDDNIVAASTRLKNAVNAFDSLSVDYEGVDSDRAQVMLDELTAARDAFEALITEYENQYATLTTTAAAAQEATLTDLLTNESAIKTKIGAWKTELNNMKECIEKIKGDTPEAKAANKAKSGTKDFESDGMGTDILVDNYKKAYDAYIKQITEIIPAADDKWDKAVDTYNDEVTKAKTAYLNENNANGTGHGIKVDQRVKDVNNNWAKNNYEGLTSNGTVALTAGNNTDSAYYLTDNSTTLVGIYSVNRLTTGVATIDKTKSDEYDWKTIGIEKTLKEGDNPILGYVKQKDATALEETTEAKYERKGEPSGSPASANKYTPAVNATAAPTDSFKTLVANGTINETVANLLAVITDDAADADDLVSKLAAAKTAYEEDLADYKKANDNVESTTQAVNKASGAVAAASDESTIKFKIVLDDPETSLNWTPNLADGTSAPSADFYYNKVLEAGETSDRLIDYVMLDPSVGTADYKSLTFDLNVALESAQVTYESDQKTYAADAVNGNDAFVYKVEKITDNSAVTWKAPDAVAPAAKEYTYRVGTKNIAAPVDLGEGGQYTDATDDTIKYRYTITVDSVTYYGTADTNGSVFYGGTADDTEKKFAKTTNPAEVTKTLTVAEKTATTTP